MRFIGIAGAVLASMCVSVKAETFTVGPGSCDFQNLNEAIAAAGNADTILVDTGYVHSGEEVEISHQSINIRGGRFRFSGCRSPFLTDVAEIRAGDGHRVFKIEALPDAPQSVTLENLKIVGGERRDSHGGGIYVTNGAYVHLRNVEVTGNIAYRGGGVAVETQGVVTTDEDVRITGNISARDGGGVWLDNGGFLFSGGIVGSNRGENGAGIACANNGTVDFQFGAVLANILTGTEGVVRGGGMFIHNCTLRTTGNPTRSRSIAANSIVAPPADGSCVGYAKGVGLGLYIGGHSTVELGSDNSGTAIVDHVAPALATGDLEFDVVDYDYFRCYENRAPASPWTGTRWRRSTM